MLAAQPGLDVLVLEPLTLRVEEDASAWRALVDRARQPPRAWPRSRRSAGAQDVAGLATPDRPRRVVLEGLTSIRRFGMAEDELARAIVDPGPADRQRIHLPGGAGPAPADRGTRAAPRRLHGHAHLGRRRCRSRWSSGRPGSTRWPPGGCCGRLCWPTWPGIDRRRNAVGQPPRRPRVRRRAHRAARSAAGGAHRDPPVAGRSARIARPGTGAGRARHERGPVGGLPPAPGAPGRAHRRRQRRNLARRRDDRASTGPQRPPARGRGRGGRAGGRGPVPLAVPPGRAAGRRGSRSPRTCTCRCCACRAAWSPPAVGDLIDCDVRFTTVHPDAIVG